MISESPLNKEKACNLFGMSRSAYYKYKKYGYTSKDESKLVALIRDICFEFAKYGYRRVTKELHRQGHYINHKKVLKLMRLNNLLVKRKKHNPKTTDSNHSFQRHPNLVKGLVVSRINQVWVSDITYITLKDNFLYLALIMDLYSRKIVGWELSRNVSTDLTLTALNKAANIRSDVKGCIHHSDHGSQYLANAYMQRLNELGMLPSMGEVGNSYDNAFAESLNKTIKNEEVWINEYETFQDAYESIDKFVKLYNERRLHSSIGYVPPNEYEEEQLNIIKVP